MNAPINLKVPFQKACLVVPVKMEPYFGEQIFEIDETNQRYIHSQLANVLKSDAKEKNIDVDSLSINKTIEHLFIRFEIAYRKHKEKASDNEAVQFVYECSLNSTQTILLAFTATLLALGLILPTRA